MQIQLLTDPLFLTVLGNVFRGAAVLLLIVLFVPGAIIAWILRRPREQSD